MPHLVVVSGAPASGKTTVSRRLASDLSIPLIAKDDIKEMLFEKLPQHDRDWSTVQGRVAIAMMYTAAEELLRAGYHVMIESSFHKEFAVKEINAMIQRVKAEVIEVHCHLDDELRQQRWATRIESGNRHPGHLDQSAQQVILHSRDAPLYPESVHLLDTGVTSEEYNNQYLKIVHELQSSLGQGGRYETTN